MSIKTRFAPSPSGGMHLGNIRTALFNALFAHHSKGVMILRIEDSDQERSKSEHVTQIIKDLHWLGLTPDEGPDAGGPSAPYYQSERKDIYSESFIHLIQNNFVYRCFCTSETLTEKRQSAHAAGKPPRYDRACLGLPPEKIKQKVAFGTPFIWRFKLNDLQRIEFKDMARGTMSFMLENFSDFSLTRPDGSFTFLYTNFIDDWKMGVSHVIRGEDHLSNTPLQGALAHAFAVPMPTFWHMPMICGTDGKKLSKRAQHFTLNDLRQAGFLPEAICNYLASISTSLAEEIQSVSELAQSMDFTHVKGGGTPHYDAEKLKWFNKKWISRLPIEKLEKRVKPLLSDELSTKFFAHSNHATIFDIVRSEASVLNDIPKLLEKVLYEPTGNLSPLHEAFNKDTIAEVITLIAEMTNKVTNFKELVENIKKEGKAVGHKPRVLFQTLRYCLVGSLSGFNMDQLEQLFDYQTICDRISHIAN